MLIEAFDRKYISTQTPWCFIKPWCMIGILAATIEPIGIVTHTKWRVALSLSSGLEIKFYWPTSLMFIITEGLVMDSVLEWHSLVLWPMGKHSCFLGIARHSDDLQESSSPWVCSWASHKVNSWARSWLLHLACSDTCEVKCHVLHFKIIFYLTCVRAEGLTGGSENAVNYLTTWTARMYSSCHTCPSVASVKGGPVTPRQ